MIENGELRALVADTMAVWGVGPDVAWDGGVLVVVGVEGRAARVRRGPPGRWLLERDGRARPCASVSALLAGLRQAVGPGGARPALRVTAGHG